MNEYADILAVERRVDNAVTVTDVRVDSGGGDTSTADDVSGAGDDSCPIPGKDVAVIAEGTGAGNRQVVGYHDPINPPKTSEGEKRIYARDAETGEVVGEIWLKNTGAISIEIFSEAPVNIKAARVNIDSPAVFVGEGASKPLARVGDLVAVTILPMVSTAPGNPVASPGLNPATGTYSASGQIVSGSSSANG